MARVGLCAAGGLVVGGLLAIPFSGDDGSSGSVATTTTVTALVPAPPPNVVTTTVAPASTGAAVSTTLDPPTTAATAPTSTVAADVPTIPGVEAAAYALIDADTGKVLAGANVDQQLAVGSLMKLLTAYVVMQAGDPTKTVVVPDLDVVQDESIIGLAPGMRYDRALLLRALLVVSAGDAAQALAVDVSGSEAAFVDQMNKAAAELGLAETVAANETGLDADGAHSSAGDVAELARVLLQDPTFRDTVDNTTAKLFGKTRPATNQAFLTGYPGATGVKTGHTTQAGYCLAASATRDGRSLIAVVLGTPTQAARTAQAEAVLDWGFAQAN
jgi:D-alanyl-D-alanine carboxypeptidase (penicillin-binding protein 5/6)